MFVMTAVRTSDHTFSHFIYPTDSELFLFFLKILFRRPFIRFYYVGVWFCDLYFHGSKIGFQFFQIIHTYSAKISSCRKKTQHKHGIAYISEYLFYEREMLVSSLKFMLIVILSLLKFKWRNLLLSLENISIDNLQLMHYHNLELSRDIINHNLSECPCYTASFGDGRGCYRCIPHFHVLLSQFGRINNY